MSLGESCAYLTLSFSKPHLLFPFTSVAYIVLLIYVNETTYLLGNLPFFKIHVNRFMAQDDSYCANVISECMLWVRGLVPLSEF